MQKSETELLLKKKTINRVKPLNPFIKKYLVKLIFNIGRFLFYFRKNNFPPEIKKILFISLYFNGDVLFQSPLFELVKARYPDAELHIWIKRRTKQVIEGYPFFTKVHIFDDVRTRKYNEIIDVNILNKIKFFKQLRHENYDLAFDLTGLFWTSFAVIYSNVKYSTGFNFQGFGFIYNNNTEAIYNGHLVDKNLLTFLNDKNINIDNYSLNKVNKRLTFYINKNSILKIDSILENKFNNNKKFIIYHTKTGWESKEWDINNFIKLTEFIKDRYNIIIIGGPEDSINAKIISDKYKNIILDLTGKLNINESAEIVRRAEYFIGSDSGPLYIAEAVGTKTIGLFGPTNPLFSAPRGDEHICIYNELFCSADKDKQNCKLNAGLNCNSFDCMKSITSEYVFQKIKDK